MRILLTGETACGKTYTAFQEARKLGGRICYMAPTMDLVMDSVKQYGSYEDSAVLAKGRAHNMGAWRHGVVNELFTTFGDDADKLNNIDVLIIDEFHWVVGQYAKQSNLIQSLIENERIPHIIGCTATVDFEIPSYFKVRKLEPRFKIERELIDFDQFCERVRAGVPSLAISHTLKEVHELDSTVWEAVKDLRESILDRKITQYRRGKLEGYVKELESRVGSKLKAAYTGANTCGLHDPYSFGQTPEELRKDGLDFDYLYSTLIKNGLLTLDEALEILAFLENKEEEIRNSWSAWYEVARTVSSRWDDTTNQKYIEDFKTRKTVCIVASKKLAQGVNILCENLWIDDWQSRTEFKQILGRLGRSPSQLGKRLTIGGNFPPEWLNGLDLPTKKIEKADEDFDGYTPPEYTATENRKFFEGIFSVEHELSHCS